MFWEIPPGRWQTASFTYAHIEIVVAFLAVNLFSCLIIASYGVGDMTWEFGEIFSYVSSTFLYLLEAKIQAIDP